MPTSNCKLSIPTSTIPCNSSRSKKQNQPSRCVSKVFFRIDYISWSAINAYRSCPYSTYFASSLSVAEAIRAKSGWKVLLIGVSSDVVILDGVTHPLDPAGLTMKGSKAAREQDIPKPPSSDHHRPHRLTRCGARCGAEIPCEISHGCTFFNPHARANTAKLRKLSGHLIVCGKRA